jgi:hypothetical protein
MRPCRQQTKKIGSRTIRSDHKVIGSGMAVALVTAKEPETPRELLEPSETVLELVKPYVPILVMALVSRSNVQDPPELLVNVATSRVDPITKEDKVAPAPGPEVTVTWLGSTLPQLDGMPEHERLKPVKADSEVELIEKL